MRSGWSEDVSGGNGVRWVCYLAIAILRHLTSALAQLTTETTIVHVTIRSTVTITLDPTACATQQPTPQLPFCWNVQWTNGIPTFPPIFSDDHPHVSEITSLPPTTLSPTPTPAQQSFLLEVVGSPPGLFLQFGDEGNMILAPLPTSDPSQHLAYFTLDGRTGMLLDAYNSTHIVLLKRDYSFDLIDIKPRQILDESPNEADPEFFFPIFQASHDYAPLSYSLPSTDIIVTGFEMADSTLQITTGTTIFNGARSPISPTTTTITIIFTPRAAGGTPRTVIKKITSASKYNIYAYLPGNRERLKLPPLFEPFKLTTKAAPYALPTRTQTSDVTSVPVGPETPSTIQYNITISTQQTETRPLARLTDLISKYSLTSYCSELLGYPTVPTLTVTSTSVKDTTITRTSTGEVVVMTTADIEEWLTKRNVPVQLSSISDDLGILDSDPLLSSACKEALPLPGVPITSTVTETSTRTITRVVSKGGGDIICYGDYCFSDRNS